MLPEQTDNDTASEAAADAEAASSDSGATDSEPVEAESSDSSEEKAAKPANDAPDDPHAYDGPSIPFIPHHALTEGMMALAFLTFGLGFIALLPAPLEARANPFLSPEGVMPEWYFLGVFKLMHMVPPVVGFAIMGVAVGVLLCWPFIDRKPRRISRRPFMLAFSFLIIGVIVGLTVLAFFHAE